MRVVFYDGESDQPGIARFDDQDVPRKGEHVWLQGLRYFVESLEWHPDMHEVHVRLIRHIEGMLEPEEERR